VQLFEKAIVTGHQEHLSQTIFTRLNFEREKLTLTSSMQFGIVK
jgi:hypothetical protein